MNKPNQKKIFEYRLFKIIVSLVSIFIIVFIAFYGKTELFKFPFISDVWGTASDWIMISVTGLTAFFLWNTLRSQRDIQGLQTNLNELQFKQHLNSIKPYFVIDEVKKESNFNGKSIYYNKIIRLNNANAYNVTIRNVYNDKSFIQLITFIAVNSKLDSEFMITSGMGRGNGYLTSSYSLSGVPPTGSTDTETIVEMLEFEYKDGEYNSYRQIMYYQSGELLFSPPENQNNED